MRPHLFHCFYSFTICFIVLLFVICFYVQHFMSVVVGFKVDLKLSLYILNGLFGHTCESLHPGVSIRPNSTGV